MNTRIIIKIGVLLLFVLSVLNVKAQITTGQVTGQINTITTAVPFLLIAPDARAGSMGDAGVSTSADHSSMHWNPAKIVFANRDMGVGVSYSPWLRALVPDINLSYLSGYKKLDDKQAIGMSLLYFSLGDITFTDVLGTPTGQFRPNEFAIDLAYSRKLSDNFSSGIAFRYINSNLTGGMNAGSQATHPGNAYAADVSFYYQKKVGEKDDIFAAGLNISNIGTKISYTESTEKDFIPINLRIGPSYTLNIDTYNKLTFTVDINKLLVPTPPMYYADSVDNSGKPVIQSGKKDNVPLVSGMFGSFSDAPGGFKEEMKEINYSVGAEYWYDKQFAIRAGYFFEDPTKGNRQYITFGAGLKYNVFGLDFAYLVPASSDVKSPLENTLRFTLYFDFEAFKEQNKQKP
ncbi:MAG: type IX secretion system outer membrane channel protein PorV [Bacteroidota bacterium]